VSGRDLKALRRPYCNYARKSGKKGKPRGSRRVSQCRDGAVKIHGVGFQKKKKKNNSSPFRQFSIYQWGRESETSRPARGPRARNKKSGAGASEQNGRRPREGVRHEKRTNAAKEIKTKKGRPCSCNEEDFSGSVEKGLAMATGVHPRKSWGPSFTSGQRCR